VALVTNGACLERRASELLVVIAIVLLLLFGFGLQRRHFEKLPAASKLLLSVTIGEDAVVPNALETERAAESGG
jgi:hypothetical protein